MDGMVKEVRIFEDFTRETGIKGCRSFSTGDGDDVTEDLGRKES